MSTRRGAPLVRRRRPIIFGDDASASLWPPVRPHFWNADQWTAVGSDVNAIADQEGTDPQGFYQAKGQVDTLGSSHPGVRLGLGGYLTPGLTPFEDMSTGFVAIVADIPQNVAVPRFLFGGYSSVGVPEDYFPIDIRPQMVVGANIFLFRRSLGEAACQNAVAIPTGRTSILFTWTPTARLVFLNGALAHQDAVASSGVVAPIEAWVIANDFHGITRYAENVILGEASVGPLFLDDPAIAAAFEAYQLAEFPV